MAYISRDPFARTTLNRIVVHANGATCAWCGGNRQHRGRALTTLFRYVSTTDSIYGRAVTHKGLFCSKSCHDSYHG
jgi:hypothetical protein